VSDVRYYPVKRNMLTCFRLLRTIATLRRVDVFQRVPALLTNNKIICFEMIVLVLFNLASLVHAYGGFNVASFLKLSPASANPFLKNPPKVNVAFCLPLTLVVL